MLRVIVFASLLILGQDAFAQSSIGVSGNFFFEDSDLSGEQQVSVQTNDESFAYVADDFLNATLYYLQPFKESGRIGGALTYYGDHIAEIPQEGEEVPEFYDFGHLIELVVRAEWLIGVTESIDLIAGAQAGIPILFPGGDFQDEIDDLKDQQASVWDIPRTGFVVGPLLSARYKYHESLYFRADIGIKYEKIFLFNTTEEVQGVPFRKDWTLTTVRTEIGLALEVDL